MLSLPSRVRIRLARIPDATSWSMTIWFLKSGQMAMLARKSSIEANGSARPASDRLAWRTRIASFGKSSTFNSPAIINSRFVRCLTMSCRSDL